MKIDWKTLSVRSWAIPSISGLLILHHDFKTPRLASVNRLVWSASSVDVYLQYGICNISGNIIDSTDIIVTLHHEGTVGIRTMQDAASKGREALLKFLAGEIAREAFRWAQDMASWTEEEWVDLNHASILGIVSALVAHPLPDMNISVEKDILNPACIRKVRLSDASLGIEMTPLGFHGASLHVKGYGTHAGILKLYQVYDMRQVSARTKSLCANLLKKASFGIRRLMLLPLDMVFFLYEQRLISEMKMASNWVEHLPASVVDSRAGESLSALSK